MRVSIVKTVQNSIELVKKTEAKDKEFLPDKQIGTG